MLFLRETANAADVSFSHTQASTDGNSQENHELKTKNKTKPYAQVTQK